MYWKRISLVELTTRNKISAVEFVNAMLRVASGEELGVKKILVPGRVATLENFKDLPNMWALDYKE